MRIVRLLQGPPVPALTGAHELGQLGAGGVEQDEVVTLLGEALGSLERGEEGGFGVEQSRAAFRDQGTDLDGVAGDAVGAEELVAAAIVPLILPSGLKWKSMWVSAGRSEALMKLGRHPLPVISALIAIPVMLTAKARSRHIAFFCQIFTAGRYRLGVGILHRVRNPILVGGNARIDAGQQIVGAGVAPSSRCPPEPGLPTKWRTADRHCRPGGSPSG
jgi:hypothetical protein